MANMKTDIKPVQLYENKWCRILVVGPIYILRSKSDMYNDQYYFRVEDAFAAIGIPKDKISFSPKPL